MPDATRSPDFPFPVRQVEVLGSRMQYVEVGEGDPILFLHGNPTSSYLWRNVIPHLAGLGRCIAPDLIGMGGSDKPDIDYRFFDHRRYLDGFIEALGLDRITLVVHDWGSGLGFDYARRHAESIKGIAFMEAIVRPLAWDDFPGGFRLGFKLFRTPVIGWAMIGWGNAFVEKVLPQATLRPLGEAEMARYRAPFRRRASRKPVWRWPNEIPIAGKPADVHEVVAAYSAWLQQTELPKLLLHAEPGGLIPAELAAWCEASMPRLERVRVGPGIHYLQEDDPQGIGRAIADWYARIG